MTSRVSGSGVRLALTRSTTSGESAGPARSHAASLASHAASLASHAASLASHAASLAGHAASLAEPALSRVHSHRGATGSLEDSTEYPPTIPVIPTTAAIAVLLPRMRQADP